ncbi:MAG: glycosyltransferase [Patescibacteria group bacterium]|nr:glycosyltransferase [Patescibacteria group bacterium]
MKISIIIPVYNEEKILEANALAVYNFCQNNLVDEWELVIVDNNSTDQTGAIAQRLANAHSMIKYLYLDKKGKGLAIKSGWETRIADIYCFMDADLATNLSALPLLINGIKEGNNIVIGSRFHRQSKVSRSMLRRLTSLAYRLVLKLILRVKINDAPCGFKAVDRQIITKVLPQVSNLEWFFDSEMVVLAEKMGYRIKEAPIVWTEARRDGDKSRVNVLNLGINYFKQVLSLSKKLRIKGL